MRAGRQDLLHLAYAVRMISDANRLKSPISKADRFYLAHDAFQKAVAEAKSIQASTGESAPLENASRAHLSFESQYEELTIQCLEVYHAERLSVIEKTSSGKRQLKSSQVTLKELSKLDGRYEFGMLKKTYEKVLNYWKDQELLLSSYDES